MRPEQDPERRKAEALVTYLDSTLVSALGAVFRDDTPEALAHWDRVLTLTAALQRVRLDPHVAAAIGAMAGRLAAWEDAEEEVPGNARLLRRHRAPGREREAKIALRRLRISAGRALAAGCLHGAVAVGVPSVEAERLMLRGLGALLDPDAAEPAGEAALAALVAGHGKRLDWDTRELLTATAKAMGWAALFAAVGGGE